MSQSQEDKREEGRLNIMSLFLASVSEISSEERAINAKNVAVPECCLPLVPRESPLPEESLSKQKTHKYFDFKLPPINGSEQSTPQSGRIPTTALSLSGTPKSVHMFSSPVSSLSATNKPTVSVSLFQRISSSVNEEKKERSLKPEDILEVARKLEAEARFKR